VRSSGKSSGSFVSLMPIADNFTSSWWDGKVWETSPTQLACWVPRASRGESPQTYWEGSFYLVG
jgi:hypothetical protein